LHGEKLIPVSQSVYAANGTPITGSSVALHCCKAHSKINREMGNSTPSKIVTPKNFNS